MTSPLHVYMHTLTPEPVLPALIRMLLEAEEELREYGGGGDGSSTSSSLAATTAWFR